MKIIRLLGKGSIHEDMGKGCQDRLSVVTAPNGRKIFCDSDGCSGSQYPEIAAQANIDTINRIFTHCSIDELTLSKLSELYPYLKQSPVPIEEDDFASCMKQIFRMELVKSAKSQLGGLPDPKDILATLLFVVREEEKTLIGHIGDGNILMFRDREVVFRSEEENGSDSSHTYFTLSNSFIERFRCDVIPTSSYDSLAMFSDGMQSMFKYEGGTIPKGAYELAVEPVKNGEINSDAELLEHLIEPISHAMHYVFDDWSIIIACDLDNKEDNPLEELSPAPLKEIFMTEFNRARGLEQPEPALNEEKPTEAPEPPEPVAKDKGEEAPFGQTSPQVQNVPKPCNEPGQAPSSPKPFESEDDFDINEEIVNRRPDQKRSVSFRYRQESVMINGRGVVDERTEIEKNGKTIKKKKKWFF